jgi:hypothetical protein
MKNAPPQQRVSGVGGVLKGFLGCPFIPIFECPFQF